MNSQIPPYKVHLTDNKMPAHQLVFLSAYLAVMTYAFAQFMGNSATLFVSQEFWHLRSPEQVLVSILQFLVFIFLMLRTVGGELLMHRVYGKEFRLNNMSHSHSSLVKYKSYWALLFHIPIMSLFMMVAVGIGKQGDTISLIVPLNVIVTIVFFYQLFQKLVIGKIVNCFNGQVANQGVILYFQAQLRYLDLSNPALFAKWNSQKKYLSRTLNNWLRINGLFSVLLWVSYFIGKSFFTESAAVIACLVFLAFNAMFDFAVVNRFYFNFYDDVNELKFKADEFVEVRSKEANPDILQAIEDHLAENSQN